MTRRRVRIAAEPAPPRWFGRAATLQELEAARTADFDLGPVPVWALVETARDASRALRAIRRGADVVLHVRLPEPERTEFLDEVHRAADEVGPLTPPTLDDDQRELLRLLRAGASLREAAAQVHVSSRTADRRLAQARRAFGVRTTSELVRIAGEP